MSDEQRKISPEHLKMLKHFVLERDRQVRLANAPLDHLLVFLAETYGIRGGYTIDSETGAIVLAVPTGAEQKE